MISRFPYYSFKEISGRGRISFTYVFVIPLTFILIALNPPTVLFTLAGTYVVSGPIRGLWLLRSRTDPVKRNPGNFPGGEP